MTDSVLTASDGIEKASILIVDDRPEKAIALVAVLEELGQRIVVAHSGREALRHVLANDFSVILLDVNMPGMDGFETAELIRQRPSSRHVPIIFVTAFSDEMHASRGYSLGAVDYIQAPVLPEVLKTKVTVFVDLFRKSQQLKQQADSLRRRAEQLHKLAAATVLINSAMSVEQMLQTIADSARGVLGTHQAVLFYLDQSDSKTRFVSVGSFSDRYRDWRERPLDLAALSNSALLRNRVPVCWTDAELRTHADWEVLANLIIPPITEGFLSAPLSGRDGSNLGLIYVTDPAAAPFGENDEAILVQLAQSGSIAVENTIYSQEREANRTKDEFLATLSHELRTPLNAILGWTELMKDEPMSPEVGHAFEVIGRNARSQATLIEDLLEVSRINTGKLVVSPKRMDLCGVICAVVESVRPTAEAKGISLHCELVSLPDVNGDADRVQQVVWNLMSNAVKFTSNGGAVHVDAAVDPDANVVRVKVRDNGQGISAEFLPYVFERFRQADSSNTRKHGGLGIGLTIVRQIIELHGGEVEVQSDGIGHGAVFSFSLPLAMAASTAAKRENAAVEPDASDILRGLHVLLVDDDPDARDVISAILRRFQATVSLAASVEAALGLLEKIVPDVVVSDISMPGEDGFSLIQRIQNMPDLSKARIPAIALTAHARPIDRVRTLAAGYGDHVVKPVTPSLLVATIRNLVTQV